MQRQSKKGFSVNPVMFSLGDETSSDSDESDAVADRNFEQRVQGVLSLQKGAILKGETDVQDKLGVAFQERYERILQTILGQKTPQE